MRIFLNIIICSCLIFLLSCGTQVPTKTKVKTKTIEGETKKIYLEEKSEKDREELIFRKSTKENNFSYEFKSREVFLIPEVLMREDIAKTYITKKKSATMFHNPLGEITGSIFALGMIEAWCLTELAAKALPGKQTNIFLDKCKDRYIGSKTRTTEEKVIKEILEFTGYYKEAYQDSLSQIYYRFSKSPNQSFDMEYLNKLECKNKNLEEFNCGRTYHLKSKNLIRNYLKINKNDEVLYPLEVNVFTNNNKIILSFSKAQLENIVSDIFSE